MQTSITQWCHLGGRAPLHPLNTKRSEEPRPASHPRQGDPAASATPPYCRTQMAGGGMEPLVLERELSASHTAGGMDLGQGGTDPEQDGTQLSHSLLSLQHLLSFWRGGPHHDWEQERGVSCVTGEGADDIPLWAAGSLCPQTELSGLGGGTAEPAGLMAVPCTGCQVGAHPSRSSETEQGLGSQSAELEWQLPRLEVVSLQGSSLQARPHSGHRDTGMLGSGQGESLGWAASSLQSGNRGPGGDRVQSHTGLPLQGPVSKEPLLYTETEQPDFAPEHVCVKQENPDWEERQECGGDCPQIKTECELEPVDSKDPLLHWEMDSGQGSTEQTDQIKTEEPDFAAEPKSVKQESSDWAVCSLQESGGDCPQIKTEREQVKLEPLDTKEPLVLLASGQGSSEQTGLQTCQIKTEQDFKPEPMCVKQERSDWAACSQPERQECGGHCPQIKTEREQVKLEPLDTKEPLPSWETGSGQGSSSQRTGQHLSSMVSPLKPSHYPPTLPTPTVTLPTPAPSSQAPPAHRPQVLLVLPLSSTILVSTTSQQPPVQQPPVHTLPDHQPLAPPLSTRQSSVKSSPDFQPITICMGCNQDFGSTPALREHMHCGDERAPKPWKCCNCARPFKTEGPLLNHMNIHGSDTHNCPECGRKFVSPHDLLIHSQIHSLVTPFKCDRCTSGFRTLNILREHKFQQHPDTWDVFCRDCGKKFLFEGSLRQHRVMHSAERPFKCMECESAFKTRGQLNNHRLIHTGEKPHRCTQCQACFRTIGHLINHRLTHTGDKRPPRVRVRPPPHTAPPRKRRKRQ
ncbi:uncharacterized protein LOC136764023 [Amia ocellicauda]|uniref:uncharacterized protein LOC136764023 n=1 Tax=Amia ocellicauda TaxID=2972642 RepID=UPI003463C8F1